MIIYVVQPGDNIYSIAEAYGVSAIRLIQENGINNPYGLVPGQTIIITIPAQVHTVQVGETLDQIERAYEITHLQMLQNNIYLFHREYIYPDDILVIRYNTIGDMTTNGVILPHINMATLEKTLPYLTYLSVLNYRTEKNGRIEAYEDDTKIVELSKNYGTAPLLMISTLNPQGDPNLEVVYEQLLDEAAQDIFINNLLDILRSKGYYGVNIVFSYLSTSNQELHKKLYIKIAGILRGENFQCFLTINPNTNAMSDIQEIDYTGFSDYVDGVVLMRFLWGLNSGPPEPVISNPHTKLYMQYLLNFFRPDQLSIGVPVIGYEWELPYVSGKSAANSLTIDSVLSLATNVNSVIEYDQESQTPFFEYYQYSYGFLIEHMVWYTDARTVDAILYFISENGLSGVGILNIMIFCYQLWLVINSQYRIIKLFPDNLT